MIFILDRHMVNVGVLDNKAPLSCPYFNDKHTETLVDFGLTFEFEVPASHDMASKIENEGYVIRPNLDGELELFRIKETYQSNRNNQRTIRVVSENSAVSDFVTQIVRPLDRTGLTLAQYAQLAVANTTWEVGRVDFVGIVDYKQDDYKTALEFLQEITELFGAELKFEVKMIGTKVDRKIVHLLDQRGNKTGKSFEYEKDIQGIEKYEDTRSIVTALYGVGKADDSGNILTFGNASITAPTGFKKVDDYIYSEEAFQRYSTDGRHIFGVYKDEDATNVIELFRNTTEKLKQLHKPITQYEVDVVLLEKLTGYEHEKVRLGDTILVKDFSMNPPILLEARVQEIERSNTDPSQDKVLLGDYIPITFSQSSAIRDLQNKVFLKEQSWSSSSELAQTALDRANDASDIALAVDQRTTPEGIIETVTGSEQYGSDLNAKANTEDLADLITTEELTNKETQIIDLVDEKIQSIDYSDFATKSEVIQTADALDFKFSSSGGVNLLHNSTGFADTNFWSRLGTGDVNTFQSVELTELGTGSAFELTNFIEITQEIAVKPNQPYTVSGYIRRVSGYGHVKVLYDSQEVTLSPQIESSEFSKLQTTFTPQGNTIRIELYVNANATVHFTGLMVNVGNVALQWQHSSGEVYNTNVLMDMNGIKVISNQYDGYTSITPNEFAGYYKENGIEKRVFTLNKDVTEVTKLKVESEISLSPVKIIQVASGIAFISEG